MSWKELSTISGDVVHFRYIADSLEKKVENCFVWDIDKTYLDTSWASLTDLLRLMIEKPLSKKNVPGTDTLIKMLIEEWQEKSGNRNFPLYFITASPPQMESRISEKLAFDGILPFGCFYKDNLHNLKPSRLWRLTKQVGYKVQALLQLRILLGSKVSQVLWGDDSESDVVIYNIYSDICARRREGAELRRLLGFFSVTPEQMDLILNLQSQIPVEDPVKKIYINLASDTDPEYYLKFGRRTVPTFNSFQTTLDLFQDQALALPRLVKVGADLIARYGFTQDELTKSFDELVRRRVLGEVATDLLIDQLKAEHLLPPDYKPSLQPVKLVPSDQHLGLDIEGGHDPWIVDHIDYLNDFR